jgi:hypothetical protein
MTSISLVTWLMNDFKERIIDLSTDIKLYNDWLTAEKLNGLSTVEKKKQISLYHLLLLVVKQIKKTYR